MTIGVTPTVQGLNQLDAAVLMEKYVLILGMINYGTPKQKEQAKQQLIDLDSSIHKHLNPISFELANRRLQYTEEELYFIDQAI